MKSVSSVARAVCIVAAASVVASCGAGGIDSTLGSPISNNDTYATIGYLWSGARNAILNKREPSTDSFNLPLSYSLPCTRGGSGSFQGSLTGTKTAGTGTATLTMTATVSACQFDEITVVRTISATGVTATGTVSILNDAWGAINVHLVAPTVTVNGVSCPEGIDVIITGTSPSAQPISTGSACGRTGAVTLP